MDEPRAPRRQRIVIALIACLSAPATAQLDDAEPRPVRSADNRAPFDLREAVMERFGLIDATVVELDGTIEPGRPCVVEVPIEGRTWTLELKPHSVRAAGFRLAVLDADGVVRDVPAGPVRTLRGHIAGEPGSRVAASALEDGLHAMIVEQDGRTRWLQPLSDAIADASDRQYVLYDDEHVIASGGDCVIADPAHAHPHDDEPVADTTAQPQQETESADAGGTAGVSECLWTAKLALEADFPYFTAYGSVGATQSKIESVINTTNLQFERDVQITHEITGILVRTSGSNDPYSATGAPQLLSQFRDQWRFIPPLPVEYDLAHLFTGRDLDGSTVGVAWSIGMVCTSGAYCLTQSDCCMPNLACAADLSAHELGHLWGAGHCDCASPAYSMNDFITCINRFHPDESIPEIISHRNSRTCLDNACAPPNDRCIDGSTLTDGAWPFTTIGASTDGPADELCAFGSPDEQVGADVWYWYQATCDGVVTADVCDADYDSRLAVYASFCPGVPDLAVACDDNSCGDGSRVSFDAAAGSWFVIRVGGFAAQQGSGTLTIGCGPACPTDLDGSGVTDVDDLMTVLLAWGTADEAADVNGSGLVDIDDLIMVIVEWGEC